MVNELFSKTLRVISVPVVLFILLLPFSFLTGWNIATLIIYWFFIAPLVAEYVPTILSGNTNQLTNSLIGMLIFYLAMVFMIYQHYKSDWFAIMMVSCVINLGSITLISKLKKVYKQPLY